MATVTNVKLSIKKGSSKSDVSITYDLCFSHCERQDESVFLERVELWGDDPVSDDRLKILSNSCVKATKACISRKINRKVSNSTLNEDPKVLWVKQSDEIFAKVSLKAFKPKNASGSSNIVNSYFD